MERYERENREERERLIQERQKLIEQNPEDLNSRLSYINTQLQRVNELLDIKEEKVDEIIREEILAPMKYRCLMAVENDDGTLSYVGHNSEEIKKFQQEKIEKIQKDNEKALQNEANNAISAQSEPEKKKEEEFEWNESLEQVLENLVDDLGFNFMQVTLDFNKHLKETEKENKVQRSISVEAVRKKWTEIEIKKYREEDAEGEELAQKVTANIEPEKAPINYDELE